jgi:DNA recombination protein RmuC
MQSLAAGVGDLKRVLSNVKNRGVLGEVQLGALLEQVLAQEQYATNVATRPGSRERVEFAIKLPGAGGENSVVWLPIDAKFPLEDYEKLQQAQDAVDAVAVEAAAKALEARIRLEAKAITEKYIEPPTTTDFALLFLPFEGLYAEVLRRPGLFDSLQREYRVTVCGPTTLAALLNSLQMGFRTLAIEKRSSEVWMVLGAVKSEFGRFAEVLASTKRQLQTVANSIDQAEVRTRQIERKLRDVEVLPGHEAGRLTE